MTMTNSLAEELATSLAPYTVQLVNFVRSVKINGDFEEINVGYLKINGAI